MTPEERKALIAEITEVVRSGAIITEEEHQWVKLAIKKEAQSIALRQAVIEKTLTGLVWGALLLVGAMALEWAKSHGFKQ